MSWGNRGGKGPEQGPWGRPPSGNGYKGGPRRGDDNGLDELLQNLQDKFRELFKGDDGHNKLILAGVAVVALLWALSGIYQVQPGEQGVVTRFGEYNRTTGAGLRYRFPIPFESVEVVNTEMVRKEAFGVQSTEAQFAADGNYHTSDSLMLTGDENIIDVSFDVQWNINQPVDYLFNVKGVEGTVRNVAESAMREVIAKTPFTRAQTEGKSQIEQETRKLIQDTLNDYKAGVRILNVNLLEAGAPGPVLDAVRDVQAARADQERSRNEAEAYRNDILPRARGQAERLLQEADAYKQEVVARAQGDTARFNSVYGQYKLAEDVTKKRMYLETMEKIYSGMSKIILDNPQGALPYLPLPGLEKKKEEESQ